MSDENLLRRALQRRVTPCVDIEPSPSSTRRHPPPSAGQAPIRQAATPHAFTSDTQYSSVRPPSAVELVQPERRCALVVEDDRVLREGAAGLLAEDGWAVIEAASLDHARELLVVVRPDIVLLDYNLSGEYASVLIDEMVYSRRNIPMVLVSASPLAIDVARARGITLVRKPFEMEELLSVVHAVTA